MGSFCRLKENLGDDHQKNISVYYLIAMQIEEYLSQLDRNIGFPIDYKKLANSLGIILQRENLNVDNDNRENFKLLGKLVNKPFTDPYIVTDTSLYIYQYRYALAYCIASYLFDYQDANYVKNNAQINKNDTDLLIKNDLASLIVLPPKLTIQQLNCYYEDSHKGLIDGNNAQQFRNFSNIELYLASINKMPVAEIRKALPLIASILKYANNRELQEQLLTHIEEDGMKRTLVKDYMQSLKTDFIL